MKILQINKFFYLRGGAERHYFDLIELLEKKGNEVIHFSMKDKRNKKSPYSKYFVSGAHFDRGLHIPSLLKLGRFFWSHEAARKLKKLIEDTKPDIAHLHLIYHHLSPSVIVTLKNLGIPVVLTIHDWQALCPNYNLSAPGYTLSEYKNRCKDRRYWHIVKDRAMKGSFLKSALVAGAGYWHHKNRWYEDGIDRYIAPSDFVRDMFLEYGWDDDQVVTIPHFMSPRLLKNSPKMKKGYKKQYILYAGRLSEEKGIQKLVEYWGKHNIPYILKIAGKGGLEKSIKQLILRYKLKNRVEMLGFVKPPKLARIMREAAAVIAPSVVYETFGLSLAEAWTQKTAVIAHNIGPFPDMVRKTKGGKVFSWESGNLWPILAKFMQNEADWYKYGNQGYRYVKRNLSSDVYYDDVMALYKEILPN